MDVKSVRVRDVDPGEGVKLLVGVVVVGLSRDGDFAGFGGLLGLVGGAVNLHRFSGGARVHLARPSTYISMIV